MKQVKLVLTFANGSCEVGSTKFTYIDRENEAVEVLLKNKEMWPDLFIKCGEQMKNEHIGSQTSDHSGVTEAGRIYIFIIFIFSFDLSTETSCFRIGL